MALLSGIFKSDLASAGVGIFLSSRLIPSVKDYDMVDSKLIWVHFKLGITSLFKSCQVLMPYFMMLLLVNDATKFMVWHCGVCEFMLGKTSRQTLNSVGGKRRKVDLVRELLEWKGLSLRMLAFLQAPKMC